MRILQIHKYFSRQRGGGSVSAFFETKELLEKKGHDVIVFSMHDRNNEYSPHKKYFAKHFDIRSVNFFKRLLLVPRTIYNRDAARQLEKLIINEKPDVAHVHNIYHYLTPSVLHVLKKHHVPIVFKLSDYYALSPNYKLFAHGAIDHSAKGHQYYKLFLERAISNSYAESFVAMCEGYIHHWLRSFDHVDYFLAPSMFMKKMCVSYGIDEKRIVLLRNVLNFNHYTPHYNKKRFFLYMGRLSEEKGIKTLLDAVALLKKRNALQNFTCVLAGDGPQREDLEKYVKEKNIDDVVHFAGYCEKGSERWKQLMQEASFSVVPSIWYDNSPIAVSESLAHATPVIVSDCGGTKEIIEDGKSGLIFAHGDATDLASKVKIFTGDESLIQNMGRDGVRRVHIVNNEEQYYKDLLSAYNHAIKKVQETSGA